jgi:hypothetical protein
VLAVTSFGLLIGVGSCFNRENANGLAVALRVFTVSCFPQWPLQMGMLGVLRVCFSFQVFLTFRYEIMPSYVDVYILALYFTFLSFLLAFLLLILCFFFNNSLFQILKAEELCTLASRSTQQISHCLRILSYRTLRASRQLRLRLETGSAYLEISQSWSLRTNHSDDLIIIHKIARPCLFIFIPYLPLEWTAGPSRLQPTSKLLLFRPC